MSYIEVIAVNTVAEKDKIMYNIENVTVIRNPELYILKRVTENSLSLYNREDGVPDELLNHICTYLIIVIPINVNLEPLTRLRGKIYFRLESIIERLKEIVDELEALQRGERSIKENINAPTPGELARLLPRLK